MAKRFSILLLLVYLSVLLSAQSFHLKITVVQNDNFDAVSLKKLDSAITILDSVFNSNEFRKELSKINFNVGNRGLTNDEIATMILTGQDDVGEPQDSSIDLRLRVYDNYKGGNEFGNTGMKTRVTSTHRCYILNNNVECYVSHLAHEYMHQIGFYDVKSWKGFKRTKTGSVPYKVGNLVSRLIKNSSHCVAQHSNCSK